MDNNSLSHTKWTCKYHIVFAPKFRRKIIYKQIRADIGHILSELCKRKGVEIIAAECMPDHVHMFVSIPPKYSVSEKLPTSLTITALRQKTPSQSRHQLRLLRLTHFCRNYYFPVTSVYSE